MQPMSGIPMIKYTLSQLTCLYQLAEFDCQLAAAKTVNMRRLTFRDGTVCDVRLVRSI